MILSSGVWNEKHHNVFDKADMLIVSGQYSDQNQADVESLYKYLNNIDDKAVTPYNGRIQVVSGKAINSDFTIINSRSVAEDVVFSIASEEDSFTGMVIVEEGKPQKDNLVVSGKSLVHSARLTTIAFSRGFFGDFGQYIVSIGLLLFAFSTAIAWSYYGDRAMTYLFGPKSIMPYRVVYVAGFFMAAFSDTTLVWTFSAVAIVVMTLPNLFGILMLRKEMKDSMNQYWDKVKDQ